MIAQLGMYDLPQMQPANDAFWSAIRAALGEGPVRLDRSQDAWNVWQRSDLLLAQTCGFPYRARLHGTVQLVGTPDYGVKGCPPGHYHSVLVARCDEPADLTAFHGKRFAYNEALSQSGWAAPVLHMRQIGITPAALVETGGHAISARAVAEHRADFAGVDVLTWALLQEHDPALTDQLQIIDQTEPTPTLPYITAMGRDAGRIAAAIRTAIETMPKESRDSLHLRALIDIPAESYLAVPTPPPPSELPLSSA